MRIVKWTFMCPKNQRQAEPSLVVKAVSRSLCVNVDSCDRIRVGSSQTQLNGKDSVHNNKMELIKECKRCLLGLSVGNMETHEFYFINSPAVFKYHCLTIKLISSAWVKLIT